MKCYNKGAAVQSTIDESRQFRQPPGNNPINFSHKCNKNLTTTICLKIALRLYQWEDYQRDLQDIVQQNDAEPITGMIHMTFLQSTTGRKSGK